MKTKTNAIMMASSLVLGLIFTGQEIQSARAASAQQPGVMVGLNQFNGEIHELRAKLTRTMKSLDELKAAANSNSTLDAPYANFSTLYADLESQVAQVRAHGTAARARAKEHREAWQKELTEMQNPKLREKAQKRYTALESEFEKITKRAEAAKEGFAPLAADLKDIHTYLKADLSKDAVSSLSNTIWKMGISSRSVDSKLGDVNEQIEKTMKKMPQS